MRTTQLLTLIASLVLPACVFAQSSIAPAPAVPSVEANAGTIRPGDAVQITVWQRPELSGEFFVANDGAIAHPFYQEVNLSGASAEAATQRVQKFLEQYESNPRVRVDPLYRVTVSGEVQVPKLYNLRPEHTVTEAISVAGGPTERGRNGRIVVYRNGEVYRFVLNDPAVPAAEMGIQSGDRIVLEHRMSVFNDFVRPTLGFVGSVASITYAWRRFTR